jgi:hypothetical protein
VREEAKEAENKVSSEGRSRKRGAGERTMLGKKGLGTRLWKMSSQLVSLKKRCDLISAASASLEPSRRTGSRVRSCKEGGESASALEQVTAGTTHLLQDRHAVLGHVDRVQRLILENGVKDLVLVVSTEGRLTEQHLVDEDSERPPIDSAAVALLEDDLFGRDETRGRSAEE